MTVPGFLAKGFAAALGFVGVAYAADLKPTVRFQEEPGKLAITVAGRPVATYVYGDDKIPRPYFAHVHGPGGVRLTRNFPPIEGQDRTDHATMHPGIWMAFGDLDGTDIWRNKGRVVHERFLEPPSGGPGRGVLAVRNRYETADGELICHEMCHRTFLVRPYGFIAANPFGRKAFRKGELSKVVVEPGESLRLRYGILLHAGEDDSGPDLKAVYADYVRLTRSIYPTRSVDESSGPSS